MTLSGNVFAALAQFGQYADYKEKTGFSGKIVFHRVIQNGQERLVAEAVNRLRFFDKIKYWFGHKDFQLATIRRIVQDAVNKVDDAALSKDVAPRKPFIEKSLEQLNWCIEKRRDKQKSFFHRIFHRTVVSVIKGERIKRVATLPLDIQKAAQMQRIFTAVLPTVKSASPIRGLRNPGCLCYCNALLKALCSSEMFLSLMEEKRDKEMYSEAERQEEEMCTQVRRVAQEGGEGEEDEKKVELIRNAERVVEERKKEFKTTIERAKEIRPAFRKVLAQINKTGDLLDHHKGVLKELNRALRTIFPELSKEREMQDAAELMESLLSATIPTLNFSVVQDRQRGGLPTSWLEALKGKEEWKDKDFSFLDGVFLPTIDKKVDPENPEFLGNRVKVNIPDSCLFDLQTFFTGQQREEQIELDGILGSEKNIGLSEEIRHALRDLVDPQLDRRKQLLPPVTVTEKQYMQGPSPEVLPIHIARFDDYGRKNTTPVQIPYVLHVPINESEGEAYVLKSVAVHGGSSIHGGHYYTYSADPDSFNSEIGMPSKWTYHSDSHVHTVSWKGTVAEDIGCNGCIFIYDKLDLVPSQKRG